MSVQLPPLGDFVESCSPQMVKALELENLQGAELIDHLILLKFVSMYQIQKILSEKSGITFAWLNVDPTPTDLRAIADQHGVIIERGRRTVVSVPLGVNLDKAVLEIDMPNVEITYRYIADCNYRMIRRGLTMDFLSNELCNIRPLLLFRRLIWSAIEHGSTDLKFSSTFSGTEKFRKHEVQYRISKEVTPCDFQLTWDLYQGVLQAVISKLTQARVADLDSDEGITTAVPDIFGDGSVDLRLTAMKVEAGYYADAAIQTLNTTVLPISKLGLPEADTETILQLAQRRTGLTLVTGEMRSGKNTTIYAMLNELKDAPITILEYSNPIENRMFFPQVDYHGDLNVLASHIRMAKKQDVDVAVLNEIPNAEVAFAVRDLVNSAIGVITTTHLNRVWHLPNKLREFFGEDYKTIISQMNAVINQKMFRRWKPGNTNMQKRILDKDSGPFEKFAYLSGVRQYFVPEDLTQMSYSLQPMVEIIVFNDEMKTAMLNFEELWRAEQMLQLKIQQAHMTLENKVAQYINNGIFSLDEMHRLY